MSERHRSSVVEVDRANDGDTRVDDNAMRKLSVKNSDIVQVFEEAKAATAGEHELTIRDTLRLYPKAIAFCVIFSTPVVIEGYDLSLMGSFFGLPPFRNFYGTENNPEGGRQISAAWQSGILNGTQVCPRSTFQVDDSLAYRLPFALQWIWPPLILVGVILAPESPWWLVRHGKYGLQGEKCQTSRANLDLVDTALCRIEAHSDQLYPIRGTRRSFICKPHIHRVNLDCQSDINATPSCADAHDCSRLCFRSSSVASRLNAYRPFRTFLFKRERDVSVRFINTL